MGVGAGMGNGDIVKGFPHGSSGRGRLVAPPSPHSLIADSDRPRQRQRRRSSSSRARGRSPLRAADSREVEPIGRGAESECSTTSTHPSALGQPYTLSLPDDSSTSNANADLDSLRKDSTDELCLKDAGAVAVVLTFTNWRLRVRCTPGANVVGEDK